MGRGIAYVAAVAGARTVLIDVDQGQLQDAVRRIHLDVEAGVERGKVAPETTERVDELLSTSTRVGDGCDGVELAIEAVVERIDVKHEVLREAEAAANEDALIATNTSSMSITEIVACLDRPERGVGMHFFNPVPKMKLCELISGLQTDPATTDRAEEAAHAMGKQTVRVEDLPGFATSRINLLIGNEAMRMLEEGVAPAEDIDTAVKLGLNHPMGPLEAGDLVGWDPRLDILEYPSDTLGDRFKPTNLHQRKVAAGRHDRETARVSSDMTPTRPDEP